MLKELKEQLEAAPTVEKKLATYFKIVDYLFGFDRELAQQYTLEGLKLAEEAEHPIFKALFLLNIISLNKYSIENKIQFNHFSYLLNVVEKIEVLSFYYFIIIAILIILPINLKTKKMNEKIIFYIYKTIDLLDADMDKKEIKETEINFKYMLYSYLFMAYIQNEEGEKALSALHLATFFVNKPISMDKKIQIDISWVFYFWFTKQYPFCIQAIEKVLNNPLCSNDNFYFYNIQMYAIQGKIYTEYYKKDDLAIQSFEKSLKVCKYFKIKYLEADLEKYISEVYEKNKDFENYYQHAKKAIGLYKSKIVENSNDYIVFLQNLTQQKKQNRQILKLLFEENISQISIPATIANKYDSLAWHNYISKNCKTPNFGVKDIALQFNLSSKTLNRHIQDVFGINTQKFITFVRMEHAAQLLLQTNKKILEIAGAVGFENVSYFGRAFKKQFGMLPSDYRKNNTI